MSWVCQTLEDTVIGLQIELEDLQNELSTASPSIKASLVRRINNINSELTPLRREYNDCAQANPKPPPEVISPSVVNDINIKISFNDFTRNNTYRLFATHLTVVIDLIADSPPEKVQVRRRYSVDSSWGDWYVMNIGNIGEQWYSGQLTDKYWVNLFYNKSLDGIEYEVRYFSENQWKDWTNKISM